MTINRRNRTRSGAILSLIVCLIVISARMHADTGTCGGQMITLPFTDVPNTNIFFCSIAQIYFQGITNGTTPTTYGPGDNVSREQMAAFLSRSQNSVLNRGSRRAALNQFWTTTPQYTVTQGAGMLGTTALGAPLRVVACDGADVWTVSANNTVLRVRASDGKFLETWTGATGAVGVLVATGRVFVLGSLKQLFVIDPSQPQGAVTTLLDTIADPPTSIAFDGQRIWTANFSSVSIITPGSPFTANNVGGFGNLQGILYDGASIWVTEFGNPTGTTPGHLKKLDANGAVTSTVTVGNDPLIPIYDGTNIWVPNFNSNSVSVVRPSDGTVLATLTGNGLNFPLSVAFDGQRILVVNGINHNSISLFRAADFSPLGTFSTGANTDPRAACSDGVNFWITLTGLQSLARF